MLLVGCLTVGKRTKNAPYVLFDKSFRQLGAQPKTSRSFSINYLVLLNAIARILTTVGLSLDRISDPKMGPSKPIHPGLGTTYLEPKGTYEIMSAGSKPGSGKKTKLTATGV